MPEQSSYPRRVSDLRDELKEANGDELTNKQRDRILVKFAESQLDLWDLVLALYNREKPQPKIPPFLSDVLKVVIAALLVWLLSDVFPRIFSVTVPPL